MGYRPLSDATLMGMTKKVIIEMLRIAEHNFFAAEETLAQQAENLRDWAPVVHGRWIRRRSSWYCSNCGKGYKIACGVVSAYTYNYCPVCGAKMDGGAEG